MKNFIIILLGVLFLNILNSCNKQDVSPFTEETSSDDNLESTLKSSWDLRVIKCYWGWIWDGSSLIWGIIDCDCFGHYGNCLPEVVISGSTKTDVYNSFLSHLDGDSLTTFFNGTDYKTIFPYIDSIGVLSDLQTGDITLHQISNLNDNFEYFIGLPNSTSFALTDSTWYDKIEFVLEVKE